MRRFPSRGSASTRARSCSATATTSAGRSTSLRRIVSYARPREVLVSEEVVRDANGDGVEFEPIGDIALEGLLEPVPLYRARAS